MAKQTLKTHITAGASVVVVRNGKRKVIPANSPDAFTEDEVAAVNRAVPGALRKPIVEVAPTVLEDDEDEDLDLDTEDEEESEDTASTAKTGKAKSGKAKSGKAKSGKADAASSEDEDI